ncbi:signal peptide peptidase SppA [Sulfurovum sp.]|uniref:signal peptide peptidase SppA n=1 Tax=Sulfurovum sp. TaxID=1969726 RepID=UPI0018071817|nr:signal peptide peptidase SppA [Sulfurovum sp.]HFU77458.1 signal peptide peptidase SppA [Campylobacterota bacterium]
MALFGFGQKEDKEVLEQKKAGWDLASAKIKTWMFILAIVAEVALIVYLARQYGAFGEMIPLGDKVAVVDFNKPVTQAFVNEVIEHMDKVKKDNAYSEVLFIMNSPGGSPTASEELSEYLKDYHKEKNVTMYIQSVAASGGYYIASAIKPLIANKNAMVGSIGVILPHYSVEKLAEKVGIEEDDLSSGEYKKPISFFKKVEEKERAYLKKQLLTPTYNNFIDSVAQNRGVKRATLLPYTEGKIYVANDSSIQGVLVDEVLVLHRLKERIKKRIDKKIQFVDIMPTDEIGFLKDKIEFKFSIDSGFDEGLR